MLGRGNTSIMTYQGDMEIVQEWMEKKIFMREHTGSGEE
jgi:hypothetical protein